MAYEVKNDVWYLDSGCSNHMTRDKSCFVNLDESVKTEVKMGNGAVTRAHGLGTIGVQTKEDTKFIHDVLFVPDLDQSLLSLGQLLEHKYALKFDDNECYIYDKKKSGKMVMKIEMQNNRSFLIKFKYDQGKYCEDQALNVHTNADSWLWHKRYGHLNFHSLQMLQQKEMAYGLPNIEEKHDVCEGCALGK